VCFGEWTATYTYTQTFHDGDELSDSASATFEVTGSQEVSLDGYVTPADPDPSVPCECATPLVEIASLAPGTGDVVETYHDISVPGAGVPLSLTRTYDSGVAQEQVTTTTTPGPLGYGWSYNLGMSLSLNTSTEVATVDQENGTLLRFSPYVSGSSPAWCAGTTNYCADQPQDLATLEQNTGGTWTMVRYGRRHPTTFSFSSAGALVGEADQGGASLTATAEAAGSGACPSTAAACTVWASSASGRSLTLAFDSSGRLSSATDGAGNTVSYCYFGQSCASGASDGGAHDLYSATVPGGATTSYGYDSSNSTAAFDHDIVSETLPTGGTVTNTFNSSGQVASQDAPPPMSPWPTTATTKALRGGRRWSRPGRAAPPAPPKKSTTSSPAGCWWPRPPGTAQRRRRRPIWTSTRRHWSARWSRTATTTWR